jgi:phage portal protein BeeE
MGILDFFRTAQPEAAQPRAMAVGMPLDSHGLYELLAGGSETESGLNISPKVAMRNTTVLRCVSLISFAIGMLPLHLHRKDDKSKADEHPLFRVLHRKPNGWQTAFEFRALMQ